MLIRLLLLSHSFWSKPSAYILVRVIWPLYAHRRIENWWIRLSRDLLKWWSWGSNLWRCVFTTCRLFGDQILEVSTNNGRKIPPTDLTSSSFWSSISIASPTAPGCVVALMMYKGSGVSAVLPHQNIQASHTYNHGGTHHQVCYNLLPPQSTLTNLSAKRACHMMSLMASCRLIPSWLWLKYAFRKWRELGGEGNYLQPNTNVLPGWTIVWTWWDQGCDLGVPATMLWLKRFLGCSVELCL